MRPATRSALASTASWTFTVPASRLARTASVGTTVTVTMTWARRSQSYVSSSSSSCAVEGGCGHPLACSTTMNGLPLSSSLLDRTGHRYTRSLCTSSVASLSVLRSTAASSAALCEARRWATDEGRSGGKDIDIVDAAKPIHIRIAEEKDSQIYTYTEYVEKFEREERASRTLGAAMSEARDNPAWMLWALLLLSMGVLTVVVSIRVRREQMRFDPKLRAVKSFDNPEGPSIGGPFHLRDVDTGKYVTDKDFHGKWLYIYFGFTNCPDVCPEEMAKMSRVIAHLDKKVGKDYWQPLFISLDPKRDTPAKIKEYLADFSPRIKGLVGTTDEVEEAARQYRVYFAIPDEEVMSDDDYLVDHSIIMYLMDPDGRFSDYTTKEFQWFESYSKLLRRMMDYERRKVEEQDARKSAGQPAVLEGQRPANVTIANVASMTDPEAKEAAEAARAKQPPPRPTTVRS